LRNYSTGRYQIPTISRYFFIYSLIYFEIKLKPPTIYSRGQPAKRGPRAGVWLS